MKFTGTRSQSAVESAFAIASGLAADGGLFVPQEFPVFTAEEFIAMSRMDYCQKAAAVLGKYLTDYSADEIKYCVEGAYKGTFDNDQPAPLADIGGNRRGRERGSAYGNSRCARKHEFHGILPGIDSSHGEYRKL